MHTSRNLVPLVETVVSDSLSSIRYKKTIEGGSCLEQHIWAKWLHNLCSMLVQLFRTEMKHSYDHVHSSDLIFYVLSCKQMICQQFHKFCPIHRVLFLGMSYVLRHWNSFMNTTLRNEIDQWLVTLNWNNSSVLSLDIFK